MTSPVLAFVLQLLLVFAAVQQIFCIYSTQSSTSVKPLRSGITAKLIRRDQYYADESDGSTPREKLEQEARRSMLRVKYLESKRKLAGTAPSPGSSPNPAAGPAAADWQTPLSDAVPAAYLMEIDLGTPPQTFVAIADTGSDLTWLKCAPCQSGCDFSSTPFQPTKSSSYAPLPCSSTPCQFLNDTGSFCQVSNSAPACPYGYAYADGSTTTGTLAQDTITLQTVNGGHQSVPDYWFGCSTNAASNTSLLQDNDGLVGLGRGNISFPSQLGKYFGNKFGYCLVNRSLSPGKVEETPLYFGTDAVPQNETLQYTPLLTNQHVSTFYYVGCTGIALNGNAISTIPTSAFAIAPNGTGGLIFDTGTTYTTLTNAIFTPFVGALQSQITKYPAFTNYKGFDLCYVASWSQWTDDYGKGVPTITFLISNTTGFVLSVENVWVELDALTVCLGMQATTSDLSIFGNVQQVGFHVLYDLEKQQVGFTKSDCTPPNFAQSDSHRNVVSLGTALVSALVSLLLLLALTQ
ncbi:unnamed protein product [Calypogeia fissa]